MKAGVFPGGTRGPPIQQKCCQSPPSDTCPRFWTETCPPPPAEVRPRKLEKFKYIFVSNLFFSLDCLLCTWNMSWIKGVLHLWALFLKTLCIFSKNKPNLDKVSYGSGQKCSTELKNYSFTSVEAIVVKLQQKMCKNQYFPCFEP